MSLEEAERRRKRWLYVLKARGMAHSDEMREFRIGDHGVDILPARVREREGR
jgi:KaiC/GvpD/RAD55 family RecA-like ATPase